METTRAANDETPVHKPVSIPFVLSFTNLTYSVKIRRKFNRSRPVTGEPVLSGNKTILDDISGAARDGEIMAVMGASGSGKSTLIDALANRIAKGSMKGEIKLNGEQFSSKLLKVISAYVMQDDLLFPMLTVEETLMFAADFRLPRTISKSKKKHRVQALINQLDLRNVANTVIGDESHRGVSGGERRRVSIGTDIIHDPILLFLDEPTSGLDSTSAFTVVKVLQRIARSGSVVIMSIHQPSSRIMGLIDRLIFLSRGKVTYNGPPSNLPMFFSDFGQSIPENENRTEFALDLIRQLEGSPGGTKSLVEFYKTWETLKTGNSIFRICIDNLSLKEAIASSISRGKLVSSGTTARGPMVPTFANPPWTEIAILSRRSFINSRRQAEHFSIRLGSVMATGFILATIFWKLDNSPRGIQERLGFFTFGMSTMYFTCGGALPVFLQEKYIFTRETAYNTYRRSSYVLSNALVSLPALVLLSISFAHLTFWAVGLDGSFLFYFLTIFASFWAGTSFVTFLSGVVRQVLIGYVIVVAVLAYFLLFSGFFITQDQIPPYWIWFHYISLIKYPYQAVMMNEFGDATKCFVRGIQVFDSTPLVAVPEAMKEKLLESISATLGMSITSSTCLTTGPDILRHQGVNDMSKWNFLWVTVAWGFFFRILFYLSLLFGSKNKRR